MAKLKVKTDIQEVTVEAESMSVNNGVLELVDAARNVVAVFPIHCLLYAVKEAE